MPSTTGATPSTPGLFTTVMKTCAGEPGGSRMPPRVMRQRFAAVLMMLETSMSVSLAAPSGKNDGSLIMGWRTSPVSPPMVATGYGNGAGELVSVNGEISAPGKLPNGITAPSLVFVRTYSSRIPAAKTFEPKILLGGSKPICPASATSSSLSGLVMTVGVMSVTATPLPATPTPPTSAPFW